MQLAAVYFIYFFLHMQIGMIAAGVTGLGWLLVVIGFGIATAVSFRGWLYRVAQHDFAAGVL